MRFESEAVPEALRRLHRLQGQVGGIARMIEDGRDCADVIQQLAAVRAALDRVGLRLMSTQLQRCLTDEAKARGEGYDREKFERLFLLLT
jgi:DNA-binding FrmR family transcriptional regulator